MIECGFEFEFGHNVRLDLIKEVIKFSYPHNKIYTLNDDSPVDKILSKNYFIFKEDASVKVLNCNIQSTEMATPVFCGEKEILFNFEKIFNILKVLQIKTNSTCSLHINIGFSDINEIEKINLGKLYLYINEKKWIKLFKRSNNIYCRKCLSDNECLKILNENNNNIQIIRKFEKILLFSNKYHNKSIALDKCKNKRLSIIEFRFIGGDYINNFDNSYLMLHEVINCMNFSIGRGKKKVSKVIDEFKSSYIKE